MISKWLAILYW